MKGKHYAVLLFAASALEEQLRALHGWHDVTPAFVAGVLTSVLTAVALFMDKPTADTDTVKLPVKLP